MSKKLTTTEFIARGKAKHGNKYDYSKTIYTTQDIKVTITCPIHGDFEQLPTNHYKYGCNKCGEDISAKKQSKSLQQFIIQANTIHNNYYTYNNANYTGARKHLSVTCPIHGDWQITPDNHLRGYGCPICKYENNPYHKSFFKDKRTCLYLLYLPEYNLYKIGITSKTIKDRYANEGTKYIVLAEQWFFNGIHAWEIEKEVLKMYSKNKYKNKTKVFKYTKNNEILNINPINYLNKRILNE